MTNDELAQNDEGDSIHCTILRRLASSLCRASGFEPSTLLQENWQKRPGIHCRAAILAANQKGAAAKIAAYNLARFVI